MPRLGRLLIPLLAALLLCGRSLSAADEAFVGVLALATKPSVAAKLQLSADVLKKLAEVVNEREDEALEIALKAKDLSAAERAALLAPFVAESEKRGLALFTAAQIAKLEQIRIDHAGLGSLGETKVAEQIGLTAAQRTQVAAILAKRPLNAAATEAERRALFASQEQELNKLLTKEQRAAWETLAGHVEATTPDNRKTVAQQTVPATAPMPDAKEPAPTKPTNSETNVDANSNVANASSSETTADGKEVRLRFNFRFAPWKEVLDWFARQADLSLVLDAPPPGTFNYADTRTYSPSEAIDLLNGVLLTKGYTLVRRERLLMLLNLEDEIPEPLVDFVTPEELDKRGKYELVKCLFPIRKLTPEEIEKELSKLIGPQGKVSVLPQARQVLVRETAGKLRAIRDVIEAADNPEGKKDERLAVIKLEHMNADEFMASARPLLGIPENVNAAPDGSLRLAVDVLNSRIVAIGKSERIQRFEEIHKLLDMSGGAAAQGEPLEHPQLEIYGVGAADPAAVLQVMQTLLAGMPEIRLTTDSKTGNLVALARPLQHATIRETLKQMQKDASEIDVMQLRRVDPQVAVLAINKLFGGDEKGPSDSGPRVESDLTMRQLFVRGTPAQVAQIRMLLEKMGESAQTPAAALEDRGNLRLIPLTGRSAQAALEQAQQLWPALRANRIRVVTPSGPPSGLVPRSVHPTDGAPDDAKENSNGDAKSKSETDSRNSPPTDKSAPSTNRPASAGATSRSPFQFVSQPGPIAPSANVPAAPPARQVAPAPNGAPVGAKKQDASKLAEIVVSIGPGGIMLASEDREALDEFESLLRSITDQSAMSSKEMTVFYLRFAKADAAAALLQEVLGGGGGGTTSAPSGGGGGGGSLLGDLAQGMLGDMGGGLLGGLLGGGGGGSITTSGAVSIIPDNRLNALIVQAKPQDLDLVEQLLKVIDQEASPEDVQTVAKPRLIPVFNTSADEIAGVVRQVYANRLNADATAAQQPRQPSPEEFMRALRGGSSRGRDARSEAKSEPAKLTIGVDVRSNSIIVSAPEPLYLEVKALVEHLDKAGATTDNTTRVIAIKRANPELVHRALSSVIGASARVNTTTVRPGSSAGPGAAPGGNFDNAPAFQTSPDQFRDEIRRRIESFNNQQRSPSGGGGRDGGSGNRSSSGGRGRD